MFQGRFRQVEGRSAKSVVMERTIRVFKNEALFTQLELLKRVLRCTCYYFCCITTNSDPSCNYRNTSPAMSKLRKLLLVFPHSFYYYFFIYKSGEEICRGRHLYESLVNCISRLMVSNHSE